MHELWTRKIIYWNAAILEVAFLWSKVRREVTYRCTNVFGYWWNHPSHYKLKKKNIIFTLHREIIKIRFGDYSRKFPEYLSLHILYNVTWIIRTSPAKSSAGILMEVFRFFFFASTNFHPLILYSITRDKRMWSGCTKGERNVVVTFPHMCFVSRSAATVAGQRSDVRDSKFYCQHSNIETDAVDILCHTYGRLAERFASGVHVILMYTDERKL